MATINPFTPKSALQNEVITTMIKKKPPELSFRLYQGRVGSTPLQCFVHSPGGQIMQSRKHAAIAIILKRAQQKAARSAR